MWSRQIGAHHHIAELDVMVRCLRRITNAKSRTHHIDAFAQRSHCVLRDVLRDVSRSVGCRAVRFLRAPGRSGLLYFLNVGVS